MKPAKHLSMIRGFHLAAILITFVACGVSRSLMTAGLCTFRNSERFAVDFPTA